MPVTTIRFNSRSMRTNSTWRCSVPPAFFQYLVLVINIESECTFAMYERDLFHPQSPRFALPFSPYVPLLSSLCISLHPDPHYTTLVGTALWLRWSRRICSPPGSNKSAPLHVPAPTPYRSSLFPPPQIDAPASRHSTALPGRYPPPPHMCVRFSAFRSLGSCSHVKPNRSDTLYAREPPLSRYSSA